MAELTTLEEKLAEVLGLAQAAQGATEKVEGMVEDEGIVAALQKCATRPQRPSAAAPTSPMPATARRRSFSKRPQETKGEATEMMSTYLGDESDGLDGFEFLTMAEAGENEITELVEWALPIQERHFADVKDGSLKLAGEKDPYEES